MERETPMVPPLAPSGGLTRAPQGAHSQTEGSFSTGEAGRKDGFDLVPPFERNSAKQKQKGGVCVTDKKEGTVPDGNQHGADGKSADEGSATQVYHKNMTAARRKAVPQKVKVTHRTHGEVLVDGGSKLIAIKNAARVWGVKPTEILGECGVWRDETGGDGCV